MLSLGYCHSVQCNHKGNEVQKDNATRSRKKLPREAACRERETRSPSFTKRTYRRKAGAARTALTTTLLAYGREGLSGLTQSLRSPGQIGKLGPKQEAGFRGQKRQPNLREDPFYCACSFCSRSCASSMSHSPTRLSSGERLFRKKVTLMPKGAFASLGSVLHIPSKRLPV